MRLSSVLTTIYISAFPALALIGHGIEMYNPSCAFACRAAIASAPLSCSEEGGRGGGHGAHGGGGVVTTPECRAGDFAFLTTLAWCINSTCAPVNVEAWRLEKYWMMKATGDVAVLPKWTYAQALQEVTEPPSREFNESDTVNSTVSVPYDSWDTEKRTMEMFEVQETLHAKYGYTIALLQAHM